MPQTQNLTPQEIQVLKDLGLDVNSENLERQIQELLEKDTDFFEKKQIEKQSDELFASTQPNFTPTKPLQFSPQAQAVFEAGQEIWQYYFTQIIQNPTENASKNPSLYDIKAYFQGADESGRMKNKSEDEKYNLLIANVRESLEVLGAKIQPKVYEFGFL